MVLAMEMVLVAMALMVLAMVERCKHEVAATAKVQ